MNWLLGWAVVVEGLWLADLEFGWPALVVGLGLVGLGLWRRIGPPVGLILALSVTTIVIRSVVASVSSPLQVGLAGGDPFGGACRPVVTQGYGPTDLVGEPIVNGVRFHTGIDLACPAGTPVHTVSDGVAHVTLSDAGFGNSVVVESGGYFVRYAHLSAVAVADGARVRAGDVIGAEGSTGFSTGPHLHFEVDRGAPSVQDSIDPRQFLAAPVAALTGRAGGRRPSSMEVS